MPVSELNKATAPIHGPARMCFRENSQIDFFPQEHLLTSLFPEQDHNFSLKAKGKLGEVSHAPSRELSGIFLEPLQLLLTPRYLQTE
jgi:hypothetical protein